jgi:hypothetical protein
MSALLRKCCPLSARTAVRFEQDFANHCNFRVSLKAHFEKQLVLLAGDWFLISKWLTTCMILELKSEKHSQGKFANPHQREIGLASYLKKGSGYK